MEIPTSVWKNLESYIMDGFGNAIYKGCMLDCLKGRSVPDQHGATGI